MRPTRFLALIGLVAFLVYVPSSSNSSSSVSSLNETTKPYMTGPGCAACTILDSAANSVGQGAPSNSTTATATASTATQFSQQGPKLVGTSAVGNVIQGESVFLSADGNTAIVGGGGDNIGAGAAWVWTRSGGVWIQQAKLVDSGAVGNANQGNSVSLSTDGNTAIGGGYLGNLGAGAARDFAAVTTDVWTSGGPYGGTVRALAIDPTTPSMLYAGTDVGVFKSIDSGGTWFAANTGPADPGGGSVTGLVIDPTTPATLYAGTWQYGGVSKSTDFGGTWAAANTGLTTEYVQAMAINPTTPATLYAGTYDGGVFKSTDSGGTWVAVNTGLTSLDVRALAINPTTPSTLYAGTYAGGIFKSTNSGGIWAAVNTGLTSPNVYALAINPTTPTTLYAGTSGGAFKSTNSGGTWVAANTGLTNLTVYALAINPTTPATLYAGTPSGGVFKSTDSGGTWAAANTGLTSPNVYALAINPTTPATLYAATYFGGVFKSANSGGTWAAANTGLTTLDVRALAINPTTPATLYAGASHHNSSGAGVFKSTDSGHTWAAVNTGLTSPNVYALAINPATPTTLYAGTSGGAFKSTNSGGTWVAANTGLTNLTVYALAINPTTPATLYAGTPGGGVFKSTDSGGTWAATNTGLTFPFVNVLAINPTTPATLYAGTNVGVFKSTNSGGTWAAANAGLPIGATGYPPNIFALAINPTTPATLYAGGNGVFKSTNSGATWAAAQTGLPSANCNALAINPTTPTTLYAGTWDFGPGAVFRSTDSGGNWAAANAGLPNVAVNALALDPTGAATLYAGLEGRSVWQLTASQCDSAVICSADSNPCSNSKSIQHEGGSGQINVSAIPGDCTWSAETTVNWITIPSTMHTGPGSTSYTVVPNDTAQSRTAIITVAGKTFTVRQYATGCTVAPLTPLTDPDALIFEAGNSSPDCPGQGVINTDKLVPSLKTAQEAFHAHVVALGGSYCLTSAWRPDAYQAHLLEVYVHWQLLKSNFSDQCHDLRVTVEAEMDKHTLKNLKIAPANAGGPHTNGNAIDVSIGGLTPEQIRSLAHDLGICRPLPQKDKVHYVLSSTDPRGECAAPSAPMNSEAAMALTANPSLPSLPGVSIKVVEQVLSDRVIYHYRLVNNSDQVIVGFHVGDNSGAPELSELPLGWDSDQGIPSTSATSAWGWQCEALAQEESDYHLLQWDTSNFSTASLPGQSLSGFSVTLAVADSSYETTHAEVILDDGSAYAVALEVDTAPLPVPSVQTFSAGGGTGTFDVLAADGQGWQTASNAGWITITAGASGSGNGTVQYLVAANTDPTIRNATITIGDQTFTVYQGINFADVPSNDPFYTDIGKLSARGVTLGCGNGNYCPNAPVLRDQMAAFILRAKGEFDPPTPASQRFNDVPPPPGGSIFYNFIDRLAVLGITVGCQTSPPLYCPSDPVKRDQMAAFILRRLGEFDPPVPGSQRFNDVPPSSVFYNFIDRMAVLGITLGCQASPPLYCPNDSVTRAQMAAFLVRAFNL
jgi:photosystem II stability/assembly factor-like uncharacterized protein